MILSQGLHGGFFYDELPFVLGVLHRTESHCDNEVRAMSPSASSRDSNEWPSHCVAFARRSLALLPSHLCRGSGTALTLNRRCPRPPPPAASGCPFWATFLPMPPPLLPSLHLLLNTRVILAHLSLSHSRKVAPEGACVRRGCGSLPLHHPTWVCGAVLTPASWGRHTPVTPSIRALDSS